MRREMLKGIQAVELFRPFDTGVWFGLGLMFAPVVVMILFGGACAILVLTGVITSSMFTTSM